MTSIAITESSIKHGMPVTMHSGLPVVTTEQISNFYGVDRKYILQNYKRNADRFVCGKHFFKIDGDEVATLRTSSRGLQISPKTRSLLLWTQRGAARHAKMLETNRAWEVFEQLEDFYFSNKEMACRSKVEDKTSTDDRTPLRGLVNRIMGKTGIHYQPLYKMIHREFSVNHIDELTPKQVAEAVEYLAGKVLEGEFLGKQEELPAPKLNIPDITMEWWYSNNFPMRVGNLERYPGHKVWHDLTLTPPMMYGEDTKSPALFLIETLEKMGFDMVGPRIEVETMRIMLGKGKQRIRVVGDGRVKYLLSI